MVQYVPPFFFFFSSRRRHTRFDCDWSSDVCSSDLAPLAGPVTEVNKALEGDPALVNRDPYGARWQITLRGKNSAELDHLLTSEAYNKQIAQERRQACSHSRSTATPASHSKPTVAYAS